MELIRVRWERGPPPLVQSSPFVSSCRAGRRPTLRAVSKSRRAGVFCAVGATIYCSGLLKTVADNSATAVGASWGHGVDGTFEGVECATMVVHSDRESLVIIVAAHIALGHGHDSPGAKHR